MATNESLVLDSLDLTTGTWGLEAFDNPPPAKRAEWAQGADADGALLVRDPLYENRTITARLRVAQQADMDTALAQLLAFSKKLEECEKQPDGLALVWTPAGATKSTTFYVLSGSITDLPVTISGDDVGWFQRTPVVTAVLTCKPFGYGATVTGTPVTGAGQFVTLTVASVAGDVPAEGRLIVTDNATQNRRYAEWGLEQRYYNAALSLQITPTVTGFGGTSTTRSGSVNTNIARGTLVTNPVAFCGTGAQSHVGTYRVKARVYPSTTNVQVRLAYGEGAGPLHRNTYQSVTTANWVEVDLGLITISPVTVGTQKWVGQIEAYSTTTGDTLDVDYLLLIPAGEGYGRARSPVSTGSPTVFAAYDTFNNTGALAGQSLAVGGTWSGAGDADDFSVGDVPPSGRAAIRTAVSDVDINTGRYAIAGTTVSTAITVQADIKTSVVVPTTYMGVLLRYTDTNNWLMVTVSSDPANLLAVRKRVAGTVTTLATAAPSPDLSLTQANTLNATVDAAGNWNVRVGAQGTALGNPIAAGVDSALATGGALASGKSGIYDVATAATANTRSYDNFQAYVPIANDTIYSGRTAEIRWDGAIQQDSTGTFYGPVPSYRGSRMLVPPAGDKNRTSRVVVKAHRQNIEIADAVNVTDSLTAAINYTPRFLVVPG